MFSERRSVDGDRWSPSAPPQWVWPVAAIRTLESSSDAACGPGFVWMRAAARSVAAAVVDVVDGSRRPVVLLVGGGNNGGDALFAGAFLARRGWPVRAVLLTEKVHDAALEAALNSGVECCYSTTLVGDARDGVLSALSVVVDGVCGVGMSGRGGLRGDAADWARRCAEKPGVRVVSVDVPSGVVPDVGELPGGVTFVADVTVACVGLLRCHVEWPVAGVCGRVVNADVAGLMTEAQVSAEVPSVPEVSAVVGASAAVGVNVVAGGVLCGEQAVGRTLAAGCVGEVFPVPGRESHKFSRGVVGVLAGSGRYRGAAVLAVRAAYAAGAGLVVLAADEPVATDVLRECPEVVVCSRSAVVAGDVPVADVWLVGPGLDLVEGETAAVLDVLWRGVWPVVADASALRWLSRECFGWRGGPTVLTPHAGELRGIGEVFGVAAESDAGGVSGVGGEKSLPRVARELASGWAAECDSGEDGVDRVVTVVVKGAPTTVVQHRAPDLVVEPDCPWLATAGSGDVLAGVIATLVAAGDDIQLASAAGVYLHALAGRIASSGGPIRASDIVDALNPAVREVLASRDVGAPSRGRSLD